MKNPFEEKYPLLFRNKNEMLPINLFGIECGNGWDDLLNCTFHSLYSEYKSKLSSFEFWQSMEPDEHYSRSKIDENILQSKKELDEAESKLVVVEQCKQKFGTLRLYCSYENEYSRGVIAMAESMSAFVCEICGNKGKTSHTGWVFTLCPICSENRDNKIKERYKNTSEKS